MSKRIFYTVNNGLFAAEMNSGGTAVYDCGSTRREVAYSAIDRYKSRNQQGFIDILFISHYDWDHVCGLYKLLTDFKVSIVVLPMIPMAAQVFAVLSTYDILMRDFYLHPVEFIKGISPDTKVIRIDGSNPDEINGEVDLENVPDGSILRGNYHICGFRERDWKYVVFNRRIFTPAETGQFLSRLGLTPGVSVYDVIAALKDRTKGIRGPKGTLKDALLNILTPQEINDINDYSMVVWSGRKSDNGDGCLYTGDYNAKRFISNLKPIYDALMADTHYIQIPHHGSIHNFDLGLCKANAQHIISASPGPYRSHKIVDPHQVIDILNAHGFAHEETFNRRDPMFP